MLIRMTKSTVCGGVAVKPGDMVEASDKDAFYLVATKAAVKVDGVAIEEAPKRGRKKAPENRMIDPEELENRDAGE